MDLYPIPEGAKKMHSSEITLRRLIKARRIGYTKIGKRYFLTQDHIDNFIKMNEVQPQGGAK